MSLRIRLFFKEIKVNNYCQAEFKDETVIPKKTPRQVAHIFAEVYYTPKGWAVDLVFVDECPLDAWDSDHYDKLCGVDEAYPQGLIREKNFDTARAAQQWLTRRMKSQGWEPEDEWHY